MRDTGLLVLALWLMMQSILSLTGFSLPYEKVVLPVLALTAGVVLFIYVLKTKIANIGLFFLGIWLILRSSLFLFNYTFPYSDMTVAILGIVSGFFLIIRK